MRVNFVRLIGKVYLQKYLLDNVTGKKDVLLKSDRTFKSTNSIYFFVYCIVKLSACPMTL